MARDAPQTDEPAPPSPREERKTSLTLLERLRANKPDAWQAMVHLYTPLVYYWCGRGGVRGADRDDLVQEVFQAAATHLGTFRRENPGDTFRGWLRGITRNLVLVHHRRAGRQPQASGGTEAFVKLQEVVDTEANWFDEEDPGSELEKVHRRLLEFARGWFEERTWLMFWQTVGEGRSPVDVAAAFGVTPAAVRKAKSRVLHRLKEEFGDLIQ